MKGTIEAKLTGTRPPACGLALRGAVLLKMLEGLDRGGNPMS